MYYTIYERIYTENHRWHHKSFQRWRKYLNSASSRLLGTIYAQFSTFRRTVSDAKLVSPPLCCRFIFYFLLFLPLVQLTVAPNNPNLFVFHFFCVPFAFSLSYLLRVSHQSERFSYVSLARRAAPPFVLY